MLPKSLFTCIGAEVTPKTFIYESNLALSQPRRENGAVGWIRYVAKTGARIFQGYTKPSIGELPPTYNSQYYQPDRKGWIIGAVPDGAYIIPIAGAPNLLNCLI